MNMKYILAGLILMAMVAAPAVFAAPTFVQAINLPQGANFNITIPGGYLALNGNTINSAMTFNTNDGSINLAGYSSVFETLRFMIY